MLIEILSSLLSRLDYRCLAVRRPLADAIRAIRHQYGRWRTDHPSWNLNTAISRIQIATKYQYPDLTEAERYLAIYLALIEPSAIVGHDDCPALTTR